VSSQVIRNAMSVERASGRSLRQWPDPVEVLNIDAAGPVVLVCEHASKFIPDEYADLGLSPADLSRHIAWDIGAAQLTRRLAVLLDAPAFLGTYSRLLVDLNRPPEAASSIPEVSEATEIVGNRLLLGSERQRRLESIFFPFHRCVAAHLQDRKRDHHPTIIFSIHSFTPVYLGQQRPWHAGVLFHGARGLGTQVISHLRGQADLNVDANVPYSASRDEDYTLFVHGDDLGIPAVLMEVRQDLIADDAGVDEWTERLARAISGACESVRDQPAGGAA